MKNNKIKLKDKKPVYTEKFGIANWLTVTRLLLMIPFIAIMSTLFALGLTGTTFYYNGITLEGKGHKLPYSILYWLNVIIFIVAMITDFVDGYYARKTKTITAFGKIFDPIADKVATTLMLIFLAITRMTYLPVIILFIVRDILVDGTRIYAIKRNIKVQANIWGKIKTILISLAIIALAFAGPWLTDAKKDDGTENTILLFYVNIPLLIGLVFSWTSGIIYMFKYLKGIKKDIRENNTFEMDVNQDKKDNKSNDNKDDNDKNLASNGNENNNEDKSDEDKTNTVTVEAEKTDSNIQIDFSKTEIFE